MRKIFLICVAAFLCGCVSFNTSQSKSSSAFWNTIPRAGSLVVIGAAGPQSKPEYVINAAREDAARKVSMFYGVHVASKSVQNVGNSAFDHYSDTDAAVSYNEDISAYLERLTYNPKRDIVKVGNTTFIRFSYPASFPGSIHYHFEKNDDGSPGWTKQRPKEIGGYPAGVGFGRKQSRVSGTYAKSCEAAAISLVENHFSSVLTRETTAEDGGTASLIIQESSGNLSNFLVLEIWMDQATEDVWTLAIAQTSN